jgi:hypothetical protein
MTEEEVEQFTDLMVKKAVLGHGWVDGRFQWRPGDEAEAFRAVIANVIVDTDLLISGAVPLSDWLESAADA